MNIKILSEAGTLAQSKDLATNTGDVSAGSRSIGNPPSRASRRIPALLSPQSEEFESQRRRDAEKTREEHRCLRGAFNMSLSPILDFLFSASRRLCGSNDWQKNEKCGGTNGEPHHADIHFASPRFNHSQAGFFGSGGYACEQDFGYHRHRRGAIFIVALGITVVLSAMLLIYVQEIRSESVIAGNRLAAAQADAVEQGAEQWCMAQIEANVPPLGTAASSAATTAVDPTTIPAEALQVGRGYFWLLHPDPTQDQLYGFGLVDESGKYNLNVATADNLINLPNLTQDMATSIVNWPTSASASTLTYETVEELLMVDNMTALTPQILYGYDLNHDGVIDDNERTAANGAAVTNGTTQDSRGMFNYVTCYSNITPAGSRGTKAPTRNGARLVPQTIGLINVNTAPYQVLMCIPGMTQANAQSLVSQRTASPPTFGDTTWVSTALGQAQATQIALYTTGLSYQYSADIVAVSGNGRSFKRVRVVIDARNQPASIVYRKDLSYLGFPLPERLRTSLQSGKGVPNDLTGTTNKQTSIGF